MLETVALARPDRDPDPLDLWPALMKLVPEREARVLELRFREGMGYREIGRLLGIGKERPRQLANQAMHRIRMAVRSRTVEEAEAAVRRQFPRLLGVTT